MKQLGPEAALTYVPTRYKWYAVVFFIVVILTAILFVADLSDTPNPARTTVPMEDDPEYKKTPENEKPMGAEGGPYR